MVWNNTIFDSLGQTDAINLDAGTPGPSAPVANKTVSDNLLAGGSYTIYAGAVGGSPTSNIVVQDNRFGQLYYAKSGLYGPAYYGAVPQARRAGHGHGRDASAHLESPASSP
jgi:hypothetical protein